MTEHYIFDLYNTLLRIHTDENREGFWEEVSAYYNRHGTSWQAEALRETYLSLCAEETERLTKAGTEYPEIRLETVFAKMYELGGAPENIYRDEQAIVKTALFFRRQSREILELYPHTLPVLRKLKQQGKKVWLLSNAQSCFTVDELKSTGLYDLFDGIYISSDHGVRKPQKEFMESMLEEYGIVREDAVMIGNDVSADIAIAYACGVCSVFLNTDGYSEEEIRQQLRTVTDNPSYHVRIIFSGDIAELPEQGV